MKTWVMWTIPIVSLILGCSLWAFILIPVDDSWLTGWYATWFTATGLSGLVFLISLIYASVKQSNLTTARIVESVLLNSRGNMNVRLEEEEIELKETITENPSSSSQRANQEIAEEQTEEDKIRSLEEQIRDLTNLVKRQKEKIVQAYLRFAPEKELLKELIKTHLDFVEFKKQKSDTLNYDECCEEYEERCQKIKSNLRKKLSKEEMNEVRLILDDCELLINSEWKLEKKRNKKRLFIEESKQNNISIGTLQIGDTNYNVTEELIKEISNIDQNKGYLEGQGHWLEQIQQHEVNVEVVPSGSSYAFS